MSEGGEFSSKGSEKRLADELQREMVEVWKKEHNWKEGKDISMEIKDLPLGTKVEVHPDGTRVLRAVIPGGPYKDTEKKHPIYVPIAEFPPNTKPKLITKKASEFFYHAVRGRVQFTGKAPSHG